MYKTLLKDGKGTTFTVQGARRDGSTDMVSRLLLQNYDDDSKRTYDMASIEAFDHFGGDRDGCGDLVFKTSEDGELREAVRIRSDLGMTLCGGFDVCSSTNDGLTVATPQGARAVRIAPDGMIIAAFGLATTSDEAVKTEIAVEDPAACAEALSSVDVLSYAYGADAGARRRLGFGASNVAEADARCVVASDGAPLSLDGNALLALVVGAVHDLRARVLALEAAHAATSSR